MIQGEDRPSYEIQAAGVFHRGTISEVSSDPYNPPGTILRDRAINGRADRPNAAHSVVCILIKGAIVDRHDGSNVLVLEGHLNEWRDEEAFHLREMRGNACSGREIRNLRVAADYIVGGTRVRYECAKPEPPQGIDFQVAAGTLRDPGPAIKQTGSRNGHSVRNRRSAYLSQYRRGGQDQTHKQKDR